ncbi:MAG TPA: YceD family protein [Candidatus Paceibacterota bacterium]|nr:YceD family protein [Verrucomicrobiota bacterium]HRZ46171.1 YceD family protein [Candidatus Paceibacterota bacterium]HRZ91668.1 YceD family protein [Candidatus Paceibacterota bacterium]
MALHINLHRLKREPIRLEGELPIEELALGSFEDECIQAQHPLGYDLTAQWFGGAILIQGRLSLRLDCTCVRCLKPLVHQLELADWTCHLPAEGEDAFQVENDCVDLTPYLREHILLAFPRHPLCDSGCRGLSWPSSRSLPAGGGPPSAEPDVSVWDELDKLNL